MRVIKLLTVVFICSALFSAKEREAEKFQCLPCGLACDDTIYVKDGVCSNCKMALVKSNSITFKNIEPSSICEYIKSHPQIILLDVRTKEEFDEKADPDFGTLKNAVNIPIQVLESRLPEIDVYKNREVIVYCSHSHRSPQAAYLLTQNGFTNVKNMTGGMSAFVNSNCKK